MHIISIILKSFVPNLRVAYVEYKTSGAPIPFKTKLTDLLAVLRSTGFFLLFVVLAIFVFLLISPGRDALLIVIEDIHDYHIWSLLSLLTGIFVWSIISEFGVRYSIYVTDNSGKSLSAERVEWRKFLQRLVAGGCLMLPSVLIIIALIVIQITEPSVRNDDMWIPLVITVLLVYWMLSILTNLYFHTYESYRKQRVEKKWFLSSTKLSPHEIYWTSKIYGIYNDYVFTLPKPGNYLAEEHKNLMPFTNFFEKATTAERNKFPQNEEQVARGVSVPCEFKFVKFEDGGADEAESFRWIYFIPLNFYQILHKQVKWIFLSALILLLTMSFLPADGDIFERLGAPGLLCGAFACWIGVYVGVLYADYAVFRKSWFSLRVFFLFVFIGSSIFNNDHPARLHHPANIARMDFKTHFRAWFANYKTEVTPDSGKYPVVFICAEGGALRTGAYTAIFLDSLQRRLAKNNIDFKKAVYAMSGVSGGSLGLGFYNAETFLNKPGDFSQSASSPPERFFRNDCLSPVIGKMFYGDLLNLMIPVHVPCFDRAIALEDSWEYAFQHIMKPGAPNTFSGDFLAGYQNQGTKPLPLLIINTTEVETGNQCWVTNVVPAKNIIYSRQRDLLRNKTGGQGVNYSTAINFSSRFPLFSPGGMLPQHKILEGKHKGRDTSYKLHYVDGGYYENTGASSMLELLNQIKRDPISKQIYPVVIYLRFSNDPANQIKDINFGNELTEIFSGIYDTRNSRTYMAVQELNQAAKYFNTDSLGGSSSSRGRGGDSSRAVITGDKTSGRKAGRLEQTGLVIDEPLAQSQRQVPMNWVLSEQSMKNIETDVSRKLNNKKGILPMIIKCKYPFPKIRR